MVVLPKDLEENEDGRTFDHEEEKQFLSYISSLPANFPDEKNSLKANDEYAPCIEIDDMMEWKHPPTYIVLRK